MLHRCVNLQIKSPTDWKSQGGQKANLFRKYLDLKIWPLLHGPSKAQDDEDAIQTRKPNELISAVSEQVIAVR